MDQLFAPWRIEWVERDDASDAPDASDASNEDCPFCRLPAADDDRRYRIVARSDRAFVLMNNYPYSPGHAMVIPYRHTGEYGALDDATLLEHGRLKARTLDALASALSPDGFNAGMNLGGQAAGGSIDDHVHEHVVPRWNGDTNFMPVVGDTQVIVEAIADTYDRLRDAFADQPGATVDGEDDAVRFTVDPDVDGT
jgi:ATP adenylyltransferase